MNLLMFRQAGEGAQGFDAGIVWRTLSGMLQSLLARAPYILVALVVLAGFLVAARIFRHMPFPHAVVLFHDATGSRGGDISREKYLGARRRAAEMSGSNGGPAPAGEAEAQGRNAL